MKKLITILIAGILLSSCDEKVSIYVYWDLEDKMERELKRFNELSNLWESLKTQEEELEDSIAELEKIVKEQQNSIKYAKTKADALVKDYNSLVYEGHWAMDFDDIADDAKDVKSALEGSPYIARIRTKGGIRY